jgi:N-acetylglucosaminyl-diphospho-decaprenol L-rhamnosyltransferase
VVAHDSAAVLSPCLDALAREGVRRLLVDNASADDSAELAEARGARVLRNRRNEGYGRASNAGVRAAGTAFVLICNPDVTLDPGAVAALLLAAERYPDAGLYAPRLVEPDGRVFFQPRSLLAPASARTPDPPEGDACAPFLSGACFLIRRDLFLDLGGFDPGIFLFYEDDDLCRRMADRGLALIHVHEAVARHDRGRSSDPRPGRIFTSRWHQAWSRAYVARKYGLRNPAPAMFALNLVKAGLARLIGRDARFERYAGSAAGAYAFLRGRTALARQGLEKSP